MAKRNVPQTTSTCPTCGQNFQHLRWHKRRRYCSLKCHYERPIDYVALFWSKVNKTVGCWEWTAAKSHGYGVVQIAKGRYDFAHRFSYELAYGPIPEGMFICHKCDNPGCVNPNHLFAGTPADNIQDAANKGRTQQGERHWNGRLTTDEVRAIRQEYAAGIGQRQLAAQFGVTNKMISLIVLRKSWKHI